MNGEMLDHPSQFLSRVQAGMLHPHQPMPLLALPAPITQGNGAFLFFMQDAAKKLRIRIRILASAPLLKHPTAAARQAEPGPGSQAPDAVHDAAKQ